MTNEKTVFTAHDVPDLIHALPTVFGFTPEDSIVAIATHGPRHRFGFSLRMDMLAGHHLSEAADHIVAHLGHQGAEGAIIIAVTEQRGLAARLVPAVEGRLGGIRPVVSAWADGERYWTTFDDCDPAGYPYEQSDHHRAVVQAITEGREILPNRAALAAKVAAEGGPRRRWLNSAAETVADQVTATIATAGQGAVVDAAMTDLGAALEGALARRRLTDGEALRLAAWATHLEVRDALWSLITPANARDMVGVWSHVARSAPPWTSAPALSLAGFAAWLSGDGALALIAAERALEIDDHYSFAGVLLQMLEQALPPSTWRPLDEAERRPA